MPNVSLAVLVVCQVIIIGSYFKAGVRVMGVLAGLCPPRRSLGAVPVRDGDQVGWPHVLLPVRVDASA